MRQQLVVLLTVAALTPPVGARAEDAYRVVDSTVTIDGDLIRTESVVQVGDHPVNRFLMFHVSKAVPPAAKRGVLLLAPSGNRETFGEYELGDDYRSTFAGALASRGVEVYGLSRRGSALVPGTCACASGEANCRDAIPIFGPALGGLLNIVNPAYQPAAYPPDDPARTEDCSVAAEWGMAADVADLAFIREQARRDLPGKKIVVGGLSNGGYTSYAAVSAEPAAYDGLIVIDLGMDAETFEHPTYQDASSECQFLTLAGLLGYTVTLERDLHEATLLGDVSAVVESVTRGNVYACTVPPYRAALLELLTGIVVPPDFSGCRTEAELEAMLAPFLASPDPFVYTLTSQLLFGADNGAYLATGDPLAGTLTFASRELAAQFYVIGNHDYQSIARQRDSACNYAGDLRFVANLGAYVGPVLTFEGGRGLGHRSGLLDRVGSTDVTRVFEPEFAHVDFNWSSRQERDLVEPVHRWLVSHVFAR